MTKTVVAIDVGAGNTKFLASRGSVTVAGGHFPSIASLASGGALASFQAGRDNADNVAVAVENAKYVVSTAPNQNTFDVARIVPGDDFQNSAHHTALLAAALHVVNLEHIDMLVVGTPVHTYDKHSNRLAAIRGTLDFGLGKHSIATTKPLPQPFGSLLAGMSEGALPGTVGGAQIVIDIGYYSIDVLRCNGLRIATKNSFSVESGMVKVYRLVADEISRRINQPVENLEKIEHCLRQRTPYIVRGVEISLDDYLPKIRAYFEEVALNIYGRAGTTEDIDSICVTGGGGKFAEAAFAKRYSGIPLRVMRDPLMSNVRGFLLAGQASVGIRTA